jgi:hypothetical protein
MMRNKEETGELDKTGVDRTGQRRLKDATKEMVWHNKRVGSEKQE